MPAAFSRGGPKRAALRDGGPDARQASAGAELRKLRGEYRFHGIKIQTTMIQADIRRLGA